MILTVKQNARKQHLKMKNDLMKMMPAEQNLSYFNIHY